MSLSANQGTSRHAIANRLRQRGAGQWPFIITLLLLLVFVYLWWDTAEQRDSAKTAQVTALENEKAAKEAFTKMATQFAETCRHVGYLTSSFNLGSFDTQKRGAIPVTDIASLKADVSIDGTRVVGDGEPVPGILAVLVKESALTFTREGRLHKQKIGAETTVDYSGLSAAFKERLDEFRSTYFPDDGDSPLKARPIQPVDPDDQAGQSQYESDMKEYEAVTEEYHNKLKELTESAEWAEFSNKISGPGEWDDPTAETITVQYYSFPEGGEQTVENVFKGIESMLKGMKDEVKAIADAYKDKLQQLLADNTAKSQSLKDMQEARDTENSNHVTELNRLTDELKSSQARATTLADEKGIAQQELTEAKETHAKDIRGVKADRDSYREGLNNSNEQRDLRIRRDVAKGNLLVASQSLKTGMIDLGTADRAYVGLKFIVSGVDNAGNRINKGEVIVTQVTGRHSSKVRIVKQSVLIAGGEKLHNPLYNPTDTMHVFIYGKLDKWSRPMATSRLKQLGVVVQDAINGNTDYIIIPNSMAAKAAAPKSEDDEDESDEDAGAVGSSPLEQLETRARRFGAVVITERLFDTFLDF